MTYRSPSLVLAALGTLLFTACASEPEEVQENNVTTPSIEAAAPAEQPYSGEVPPSAEQILPATTGGSPKLNPPHGEPGHVCAIPVGEPLDGSSGGAGSTNQTINMVPPTNGAAPTFSTMPPGSPVNNAPASGGSGRINPAHGEPGHVCEIPVGQPLP
jgi:hypothetical protein